LDFNQTSGKKKEQSMNKEVEKLLSAQSNKSARWNCCSSGLIL